MLHRSILATAVPLLILLAAPVAEARECRPLHMDMSPPTQPGQSDAERMAIHTWKVHVQELYGRDFADWTKAQSKKIECEKSGQYFTCWIEGEPCR